MLYFNNVSPDKYYIGNSSITKMYLGTILVYSGFPMYFLLDSGILDKSKLDEEYTIFSDVTLSGNFTYSTVPWEGQTISPTSIPTYSLDRRDTYLYNTNTFTDSTITTGARVEYSSSTLSVNPSSGAMTIPIANSASLTTLGLVTVTYTLNGKTISKTTNIVQQGRPLYTVSLSGENCTLTGAGTYFAGESVTITCTPNSGLEFASWSDGNTNASRTFIINSNVTLTATVLAVQSISSSEDFDYTGSVQSIGLPVGTYKLECWGALGSAGKNIYSWSGVQPGNGGYSLGILSLNNYTTLYICVGQQGSVPTGGYNGGGTANGSYDGTACSGGGGGCTSISLASGTVKELGSSSNILIIAGGGGGAGYCNGPNFNSGGAGGGTSGQNTKDTGVYGRDNTNNSSRLSSGGTLSSAGANGGFGYGGNGCGTSAAGGGGGLYGGGSGDTGAGGGGGSGYLSSSLTSASTYMGTLSFSSPTGTAETGHSGNGYARITRITTGGEDDNNLSSNNGLPSEYQEVEYLQSYGTSDYSSSGQYIDTSFIPNQNTSIELKYLITNQTYYQFVCGTETPRYSFIVTPSASSNNLRVDYGSDITTVSLVNDQQTHVLKSNKNIFYLDNVVLGTNSSLTFTASYSLTLFANHLSASVHYHSKSKIYYCKIWDDTTLVRNLIPCYRKSDMVAGMYDTITNQFYTNQGTGSFSCGSLIS